MSERRIGVFGGTFDPIHCGHLEVARAIAWKLDLDRLSIVPAHRPPHKNARPISSAYHRYAMAALATISDERIDVSTIELDSPERPYTYQTVETLRERLGATARLFCLIGADSFEEIHLWREPERIRTAANIVVVSRPHHSLATSHLPASFLASLVDFRGGSGGRETEMRTAGGVYLTDYVDSAISSTEIRRKARDGEPLDGLVPPGVADYIRKYQLYGRRTDES